MNCEHCDNTRIEPFETSGYPPEPCSVCRTVEGRKKAKNYIASHTWARLTWAQRAHENKTIIVDIDSKRSWITYYHLPRTVVVCETLSQMQF